MRGVRCVGAFGRYRGREGFRGLFGDLGEISHLEELGIYKTKLLKLIFKKQNRVRK
jgi:hypothetical protein